MNKQELVSTIVGREEFSHLTKKETTAVLDTVIDTIKTCVQKGEDVSLIGFGTFTQAKRAARMGVNPSTGAKLQIAAKTLPKFRPGKAFKELVNGK